MRKKFSKSKYYEEADENKLRIVDIILSKTTDELQANKTYNLDNIKAVAKFSDNTTKEVKLVWNTYSGQDGKFKDNIYIPPFDEKIVRLRASCKGYSDCFETELRLNIHTKNIFGNKGLITPEGVKFHLTNGIIVEIEPNSVSETFEVNFEPDKSYGNFKPASGQIVFSCDVGKVNKIFLYANGNGIKSTMCCFMPDINEIVIKDAFDYDKTANFFVYYNNFLNSQTEAIKGRVTFFICFNNSEAQASFKKELAGKKAIVIQPIKLPFYNQYKDSCWAATWLMLMKGYSNKLNKDFDSIYKIIKEIKKNSSIANANNGNLIRMFKFDPENPFECGRTRADTAKLFERIRLYDIMRKYSPMPVNTYYCDFPDALINFAVEKLSQNKPVRVEDYFHSYIICGFEAPENSYKLDEKKGIYDYYPKKNVFLD